MSDLEYRTMEYLVNIKKHRKLHLVLIMVGYWKDGKHMVVIPAGRKKGRMEGREI